jgi:AcrR family transcriptional regulator
MGRKKDPKSKENIIKAAFILFLEKGYSDVTIKNITEATGLSKGAVYHHFTSKEEIYVATLEVFYFDLVNQEAEQLITGNFVTDIENIYHFAAEVFARIENLKPSGLDFPIRNYFNFHLESETHSEVRARIRESVIRYRKLTEGIVRKAQENGQISTEWDPEAIALQILGMVEGIAINHSTVKGDIKNVLLSKYKQVFTPFFKMIGVA